MAGLAALTADYSASESDDERDHLEETHQQQKEREAKQREAADASRPPSSLSLDRVRSTPASAANSARSTPTKPTRLVSYLEEEDDDEEETNSGEDQEEQEEGETNGQNEEIKDDDKNADVVPMDLDSENDGEGGGNDDNGPAGEEGDENEKDILNESTGIQVEAWSGVQLPPEPQGDCDPELQESIRSLYKRKVETGYDMNAVIQKRKAFRNPSIYDKLIQFCELDETGTNFPLELYDGHLFGKESYYEELAKVQASEMDKREKAAKSKGPSSAPSPASSSAQIAITHAELQKKISKWDQAAKNTSTIPISNRPQTKPASLPKVAAPQVVSAGAAKSISAFGPLKK